MTVDPNMEQFADFFIFYAVFFAACQYSGDISGL